MNREKEKNYMDAPADLESKLIALIDDLDKQELYKRKRTEKLVMKIASIAASLLILVSIGFFVNKKYKIVNHQTGDKELGLEAQKALELVAVNLNKGLDQIELINKQIEKTNHLLDKSFNN